MCYGIATRHWYVLWLIETWHHTECSIRILNSRYFGDIIESRFSPPWFCLATYIIHLSFFSLSLMSVTCRWYILTFWLAPWPNVSSGITGTGMIFTMVALANWSIHWISTNQLPFGNTFWCLWNLLDILVHYAAACMRVTQPMSKMDDPHHTTAHLIGNTALLFVP